MGNCQTRQNVPAPPLIEYINSVIYSNLSEEEKLVLHDSLSAFINRSVKCDDFKTAYFTVLFPKFVKVSKDKWFNMSSVFDVSSRVAERWIDREKHAEYPEAVKYQNSELFDKIVTHINEAIHNHAPDKYKKSQYIIDTIKQSRLINYIKYTGWTGKFGRYTLWTPSEEDFSNLKYGLVNASEWACNIETSKIKDLFPLIVLECKVCLMPCSV